MGLNLARISTEMTSQPRRSKARSTLPVPQKRTKALISYAHVFHPGPFCLCLFMGATVCLPCKRLLGCARTVLAFALFSLYSLAHCFRCCIQLALVIYYVTSKKLLDVQRDAPTYRCRSPKLRLSVSSRRTIPFKVNPCELA